MTEPARSRALARARPTVLALLLAIAAGGCAAPTDDDDSAAAPAGWTTAADLLDPLQEQAVVRWGDEIVILGGFDDAAASVARVEAYDPSTDAWRALPPLVVPAHHISATVFDGAIYVFGGNLGFDFEPIAFVARLEEGAGAWEVVGEMPLGTARGSSVIGVLAGRVHLVGGLGVAGVTAEHHAWDPDTDLWEALAPLPEPTDHAAGGVVAGRLVVAGGRSGSAGSHRPDTWLYDAVTDAWEAGPPMPTSRGGVAHAVLDGRLIVIGGEGHPEQADGVYEETEAWDVEAGTWAMLDPAPVPVHGTGAAVLDGAIHVPGGAPREGFGPPFAVHQVFRP